MSAQNNEQDIIRDEVFGTLRFDAKARSYEANIPFPSGGSILVTIDSMGIAPGEALKKAREIYRVVIVRESEYRRNVASQFLSLYNESCADTDKVDTHELMRRLSLSAVTLGPSESAATIYYADAGLFGGHFIEVFLNEDFSFARAQLAG